MPDFVTKGNIEVTGNIKGKVVDKAGQVFNVKAYGAKGDGRKIWGADMSTTPTGGDTANTLTDAWGFFTAADVGKRIIVSGAGAAGADLDTTIASVTSSSKVELASPALTTVVDTQAVWGTDDTTAIRAAIVDAVLSWGEPNTVDFNDGKRGGIVDFPPGMYMIFSTDGLHANAHFLLDNVHRVTMQGCGESSILHACTRNLSLFRVTTGCSAWHWNNLTLDRIKFATSGGHGIHFVNWFACPRWKGNQLTIKNQWNGLYAESARPQVSAWVSCHFIENVNDGVDLTMNNDEIFNACYFTRNGRHGIKIGDPSAAVDSDGGVYLNGCSSYWNNQWNVIVDSHADHWSQNVFIDGGLYDKGAASGTSGGGIYMKNVVNTRINTRVSWSDRYGIWLENCWDVNLSGTQITDCNREGLTIAGTSENVTAPGLLVIACAKESPTTNFYSVKFSGNCHDIHIPDAIIGNGTDWTWPVAPATDLDRTLTVNGVRVDATSGTPNDIFMPNIKFVGISNANKFTTTGTVGTRIIWGEVSSVGTSLNNGTNNKSIDIGRDNLSQICSVNDYLYLNYGVATGVDLRNSALHVTATRLLGYNRFDPTYGLDMRGGSLRIQAIATPAAPSLSTSTTGGTLAAGTYTYWVVAEGPAGNKTLVGASAAQVTTGTTSTVTITFPTTPGASKFYALRKATAPTAGATESILVGSVDATGAAGVPYTTLVDTGAALASFTVPSRNATADLLLDGRIQMGSSSTNNSLLMSDTTGIATWKVKPYNASSAAQSPAANATTYLTNSNITLVGTPLAVGSTIKWKLYFTKTGAGTAAKSILIKVGTAGTTADATAVTLALPTGTAVADTGYAEVLFTVRGPLGATASVVGSTVATHNLQTTGLFTLPNPVVTGTGTINTTTNNLIIGLAFTSGASEAWTFVQVSAEAENIYI